MSKKQVLAISGSPSPASKTARVADYVLGMLASEDVDVQHIRLSELDPSAVLRGGVDDPGMQAFLAGVDNAHGIVVATPIFKASFSGLLKVALDVLPQFGLAGKVVLPVGTGGSVAHVLALDYALRPVLQSLGARHIVQAHFICERDVDFTQATLSMPPEVAGPLRAAVCNFSHSLTDQAIALTLGHPRPLDMVNELG